MAIYIDKKPLVVIPKEVLKAEKLIRSTYPEIYYVVSSYRNCKSISEEEIDSIRFKCRSVSWSLISKMVSDFMGFENGEFTEKEPTPPKRYFSSPGQGNYRGKKIH